MTITGNKQVEFNGLLLDGSAGYEIQEITGLAGYPDVRTADQPLLARHGLHPGVDLFGGRSIQLTVVVHAEDEQAFADAVRALRTAFVPTITGTLTFQLAGVADDQPARVTARCRELALPMRSDWWAGYGLAGIELFATDPLIYSETEHELSTTLPESPEGLTWPLSWPLTWGAVSAAGTIVADNDGSFNAPVVLRIDGPVTDPRIENLTVGRTIELDMTLAEGEFVVIDTKARTVLLAGTANRYSNLTPDNQWWDLAPGANEITFRASTPDEALLTVTWRSAWA